MAHSATKSLCGHSDVIAGAVIVKDEKLAEDLYLIHNGEGAVLGPFDSYLLLRGIKTLGVRVDRQQANAEEIARFLSAHSLVKQVYYPSLLDKKSLGVHARQARGNGSVVSFETGALELSRQVVESLKLFPITVGLQLWNANSSGTHLFLTNLVVCGALVSAIPLLIGCLILQRYWRGGLGAGSVKG